MFIQKYLKGIFFSIFIILVSSIEVEQITSGNIALNGKCNWKAVGTQCQRGLQCSKLKGICLKKDGEACQNASECHGGKCRRRKCH